MKSGIFGFLAISMIACFSIDAARAATEAGTSIGEPASVALDAAMAVGPLATLQNDLDAPDLVDQDLSRWSDEQVTQAYAASLEQVSFWLDTVRASPADLNALANDQVASLAGGGRGHAMSGVACLALAIQGEAGGEPTEGKQAVAATVMSRAAGNPQRVCAAVFAASQFESMQHRQSVSADSLRVAKMSITQKVSCTWDHFINKHLQLSMGRKIPDWVFNMEKKGCPHKQIGEQTYYKACACGL